MGHQRKNKFYREEVLRILGLHRDELAERYGVTRIGIFGSVARGDVTEVSDVDVVVEMMKPDLFYMVHIKEELEEALHCPVDIVHYRQQMNEFLKKRINSEAVYV
ncbi:MAG: nucleotidyltransferase domain-containing protein [Desulfoarculaceae bacterium]|nr:nucleotidyltransferase domain-containing protein [Desulfoarculaceae bacterium]